MIAFARDDYGQYVGELYRAVGVSGPTEWGALPPEDKLFWEAWFAERSDRSAEELDQLNQVIDRRV